ncbi:Synaptic functional regulator FMR1 [Gryllus bimaculatus]|nr:Synaptic functional regulator FMR1 [Gryllus bimaculatus]
MLTNQRVSLYDICTPLVSFSITSNPGCLWYKSKMEALAVEVCGENGAYYKAFVTDVFEEEVSVAFENDWQPESKFPFSQVRLPPDASLGKTDFTEHQEIEVFSRANDQEACGWWKAIIKMIKGDFHVVEYLGWENTYTEIVPSDRLRPKNPNPPINKSTFFKFEIEVPEELREYAKVETAHKEFQKAIEAAICRYVPERGVLSCISRCETSKKRSAMLQEMHFRNLTQKVLLLKRTEEAARQLESTKLQTSGGYSDEFSVREDLMGLAIGAHGANIQQARKVEGITNIELEENSCTFKIYGETADSVKKARSMLEYSEDTIQVNYLMFTLLQVRVKIEGDNEPQPTIPREEGQVPFVFVGTVESIANAKVLLEYHLAHLKEVEALRQEKSEIDQQLRSIHGSTMASMQSFPLQRRNDRGYNSDMDGGSNRGRGGPMRGRGRGRGSAGRHSESRFNAGNTITDYINSIDGKKGPGQSTSRGRGGRGGGERGRGSKGAGGGATEKERSRHATPDTTDERVRDLPPRQHQYQTGPRQNQSRQPARRDHRRDERRRMTDDEDTVMDSQDVSSVDRGTHVHPPGPQPLQRCGDLCKGMVNHEDLSSETEDLNAFFLAEDVTDIDRIQTHPLPQH